MESFDGITILPQTVWDSPDRIFSSDACLTHCGGWSDGEAFTTEFPNWLKNRSDVHINELELITVIIALKIWGDRVKNRNILAYCDNAVSVEVVNAGRVNNHFLQACLCEICFLTARNNAVIKLVHISSETNRISDCLSRWNDEQKREEFWPIMGRKEVRFINIPQKLFRFTHDW